MSNGQEEYSNNELLAILHRVITEHGRMGRIPYNSMARKKGLPLSWTYYHRFDGWLKALDLAEAFDPESTSECSSELTELEQGILRVANRNKDLELICNSLDKSPKSVREGIESLQGKGYIIEIEEGENVSLSKVPKPHDDINIERFYGGSCKIGLLGDTQMGSRHERPDVLNAIYDLYEQEGIQKVFHAGDLLDGDHVYRGQEYDLMHMGADRQVRHTIETYPKKEGIKTFFITGNHDLCYYIRTGYDIGKGLLTKERKDMIYLGPEEADVLLYAEGEEEKSTPAILRLFHPGGTGSAYALSYRAQKTIESYSGGEKPSILAIGHLHKASYFFIRNVHTIQVGCTQEQTRFMRNRGIQAHVGAFIVEFTLEENGTITRFKNEFIPFYGG